MTTPHPTPTLESIKEDYNAYGYLEDYQVEWMMDRLQQISECVDNAYRFGNESMINEIERILMNKESDENCQKLRGSQL